MSLEEIESALKNAIAHGYSLEQAVQSFISAGYSQKDVQEAAHLLTLGTTTLTQASSQPVPQFPQNLPSASVISSLSIPASPTLSTPSQEVARSPLSLQPAPLPNQPLPQQLPQPLPPQKTVGRRITVILITAFVVLLAILILTIIFGNQLLKFFFS